MLSFPTKALFRAVHLQFTRPASTSTRIPRGLSSILQKNSNDVVITFAKRTAVGRAKKGQWKDTTVDELICALFKARHHFIFYPVWFENSLPSRLLLRRPSLTLTKLMIYVLVSIHFSLSLDSIPRFMSLYNSLLYVIHPPRFIFLEQRRLLLVSLIRSLYLPSTVSVPQV